MLHWYIVYFNAPFNNANIYVIIARILFPLLFIFWITPTTNSIPSINIPTEIAHTIFVHPKYHAAVPHSIQPNNKVIVIFLYSFFSSVQMGFDAVSSGLKITTAMDPLIVKRSGIDCKLIMSIAFTQRRHNMIESIVNIVQRTSVFAWLPPAYVRSERNVM